MEIYLNFVSETLTEIESNEDNKKSLYLSRLDYKSVICSCDVCWTKALQRCCKGGRAVLPLMHFLGL